MKYGRLVFWSGVTLCAAGALTATIAYRHVPQEKFKGVAIIWSDGTKCAASNADCLRKRWPTGGELHVHDDFPAAKPEAPKPPEVKPAPKAEPAPPPVRRAKRRRNKDDD